MGTRRFSYFFDGGLGVTYLLDKNGVKGLVYPSQKWRKL